MAAKNGAAPLPELVGASGKLAVLDRLLVKLAERGHRARSSKKVTDDAPPADEPKAEAAADEAPPAEE